MTPNDPEYQPVFDAIQQEQMGAFFTYRDDTYDYIERDNESCEVGLAERPLQGILVPRGGTEAQVREEIEGLREAFRNAQDEEDFEEQYGPPNEAVKQLFADRERFLTATDDEIFVVFHSDCQPCHTVQKSLPTDREWPEGWGEFHDEWNVLGNWNDEPAFHEVWDRRKVPLKEAIRRVAEMKPIPPPERLPFAIDPKYKQQIDELLPRLAPFNEATDPYNFVKDQKTLRTTLAQYYAILASKKLMLLMGGHKPPYVNIQGAEGRYCLSFQQCQYDDWNGWHTFFQQHGQVAEWTNRTYEGFPVAHLDFSNDPDFAQAEQKVYDVRIDYYDSHASGY
jgi:hypothetical protein